MKQQQAIFLDRDGTLNEDTGYVHTIEDFSLYPYTIEALRHLQDAGYMLIVLSNQSGIDRGYYTKEDVYKVHDHMCTLLEDAGIHIAEIYICPHTPEKGCDCRKPMTKHVMEAKEKHDLDLQQSWLIGDKDTDIEPAHKIGARSVFVLSGHGIEHLEKARGKKPTYIARDLLQAATYIVGTVQENIEKKIVARSSVRTLAERLKNKKKRIVTLNGAFDILHEGHDNILTEAKHQGDVLVVGINSDASVQKNKGSERPFNSEINRARMLACFSAVDYVFVFDEETPLAFLEEIKPDVHTNGSDYGEDCIEKPIVEKYGGKIHIVELIPHVSTTKLVGEKM